MLTIAPLLAMLLGCQEGPLFTNIQAVEVQVVSANGLKRTELEQTGLNRVAGCLYNTSEVKQNATEKRQLLQTTYLMIVRDNTGTRNFEMITDYHMKGNKGRYYENACVHELVKEYVLKKM